jgi:hypothetical protein
MSFGGTDLKNVNYKRKYSQLNIQRENRQQFGIQ